MRANQPTTLGILIILMLAASALAKVAPLPLKKIIKDSDVIVRGKVRSVMECYWDSSLGNLKIAELEVAQTIKGDPHLRRLYFWASPSWSCDISNARDGETLLLLLDRDETRLSEASVFSRENKVLANLLRKYLRGYPVFFIAHHGGGKMIIENNLIELNHYIDYPQNFKVVRRKPTEYSYDVFTNLDRVMPYIKQKTSLFRNRG